MLLLTIHSIVRWIVVIITIIALLDNLWGWLQSKEYTVRDGRIMSIFVGFLDLQLILGMILLFTLGFTRYRIEHGVTLILTVTLAHIYNQWRDKADQIKFRNNSMLIIVIMILVFVAVSALPQGWLG